MTRLRHLGERHVGRDVADPQPVVHQHHAAALAAGELGQDLGVAGVAVAGQMQRLLADRRGHDGVDRTGDGESHGALDRGVGEAARLGAELARLDRGLGPRRLDHRHPRPGDHVVAGGDLRAAAEAAGDLLEAARRADDRQRELAGGDARRQVARRGEHDLRPDPRRVTHGQAEPHGHEVPPSG